MFSEEMYQYELEVMYRRGLREGSIEGFALSEVRSLDRFEEHIVDVVTSLEKHFFSKNSIFHN